MPDLDALPALLDRQAATVIAPAFAGIVRRSRRRRQSRLAAVSAVLVLAALPAAGVLTDFGDNSSRQEQVAVTPTETLDGYLQAPGSRPEIVGTPVLRLVVTSATVSPGPGPSQLDLVLDVGSGRALALVLPGQTITFAIGRDLVETSLFQSAVTGGELQLAGPFTEEQATAYARRLTDRVTVQAD